MKKQTVFTLVCLTGIALVGVGGFIINNGKENENQVIQESKNSVNEEKKVSKVNESSSSTESTAKFSEINMISDITDSDINRLIDLEVEIVSIEEENFKELNITTRDESGTIVLVIPNDYINKIDTSTGTVLEIIGRVQKQDNYYQIVPKDKSSVAVVSTSKKFTMGEGEGVEKTAVKGPTEIILGSNELTPEHNQKIVTIEGVYELGYIIIPSGQTVNIFSNDLMNSEMESPYESDDIIRVTGIVEGENSFSITPLSSNEIGELNFFEEGVLNKISAASLSKDEDFNNHIYFFEGIPQSIVTNSQEISFYLNDQTGLVETKIDIFNDTDEELEEKLSVLNEASINSSIMIFEVVVEQYPGSDSSLRVINYRNEY